VVGSSGRIAAEALSAAGFIVDVFDCFGDADTRLAARCVSILPALADAPGIPDPASLLREVQEWIEAHPTGYVVPVSGFEANPEIWETIPLNAHYLGNLPQSIKRCKDPWKFARACDALDLLSPQVLEPHPSLLPLPPLVSPIQVTPYEASHAFPMGSSHPKKRPVTWLKKSIGASGGAHIGEVSWEDAVRLKAPFYAQQHIPGQSLSALFLNTEDCHILSIHQQYVCPSSNAPFRFGGLVSWEDLPLRPKNLLIRACEQLAKKFNLVGLNSLDAIWDGENLWLLELNPRPSASLALFQGEPLASLFVAHLYACANLVQTENSTLNINPNSSLEKSITLSLPNYKNLSIQNQRNSLNRGMAIVYASQLLSIPADFRFPSGCHDLPTLPRTFQSGEPVCSIVVSDGGLGKLRAHFKALRECLKPVAGVDLLSSL